MIIYFLFSTRQIFNKATKTTHWESYKMSLTKYQKEINAERFLWREYC